MKVIRMAQPEQLTERMERIKALANIFAMCEQVTRYDTATEKEAWTLAHALNDIEESFIKIFAEKLPLLMTSSVLTSAAINDVLLDIGEELRHILYHVNDPAFYRYLTHANEAQR